MPKFNVSCDLLVPVLLEVEARDEDEAEDKVCAMSPTVLLEKHANTEPGGISVINFDIGPAGR